jgi:DNA-directed RNA polymerase specialized sigma24 family protein
MLTAKHGQNAESKNRVLTHEIGEIAEISDLLFRRIEKKIEDLRTIEASLDTKISSLERLLQQSHCSVAEAEAPVPRREVVSLKQRGFTTAEISETLGLPAGEVELILAVHLQRA